MDKMREEFEEAWAKSRTSEESVGNKPLRSEIDVDRYRGDAVNFAWMWWQRSRAALCVELPRQTYDEDLDCDTMIAHHVGKALDAAGVRYR